MTTTETTTPMDRTIAKIKRERFEYPNARTPSPRVLAALAEAYVAGYEEAAADDETGVAFEDDGCVIKAMKAQMSPDTLEAIWYGIEHQLELEDNDDTKRQLEWLRAEISKALGV